SRWQARAPFVVCPAYESQSHRDAQTKCARSAGRGGARCDPSSRAASGQGGACRQIYRTRTRRFADRGPAPRGLPRPAQQSGHRGLQAGRGKLTARPPAMLFFLCVVLPPLAVLLTGRIGSFFLSLLLTLLGWFPGVIHAFFVVSDYKNEKR